MNANNYYLKAAQIIETTAEQTQLVIRSEINNSHSGR